MPCETGQHGLAWVEWWSASGALINLQPFICPLLLPLSKCLSVLVTSNRIFADSLKVLANPFLFLSLN